MGCGSSGVIAGIGNPQGSISAQAGSFFLNTQTGTLFVKIGGGNGPTGWYRVPHGADSFGYPFGNTARGTGPGTAAMQGVELSTGSLTAASTQFNNTFNGGNTLQLLGAYSLAAAGSNVLFRTGTIATSGHVGMGQDNNPNFDFDMVQIIRTTPRPQSVSTATDLTNVRLWIMVLIQNATEVVLGSLANSDLLATACATAIPVNIGACGMALRFSTGAADAGWTAVTTNDNGAAFSQTTTLLTTGAAVAIDTTYKVRIRYLSTGTPTAFFSINDGLETLVTANVGPGAGSSSGSNRLLVCYASLTNLSAAALKSFGWGKTYVDYGRQL